METWDSRHWRTSKTCTTARSLVVGPTSQLTTGEKKIRPGPAQRLSMFLAFRNSAYFLAHLCGKCSFSMRCDEGPHIARGSSDKFGNPSTAFSSLAFLAPMFNKRSHKHQSVRCLPGILVAISYFWNAWSLPVLSCVCVCLARYIDIGSVRTTQMWLVQLSIAALHHSILLNITVLLCRSWQPGEAVLPLILRTLLVARWAVGAGGGHLAEENRTSSRACIVCCTILK